MSLHRHYNHIIIVGATSGLGQGLARRYASKGCSVTVCGRRADRLNELVEEFPTSVDAALLDVTATDAASRFQSIIASHPATDLVINCAGIGYNNTDLDTERDVATVMTNCVGFTAICDTAFNHFVSHGGGQLAAITSVAATKALGQAISYSASKRFQANYLQGLTQLSRMQRLNITVTDLRPGFTATALLNPDRHYPMLMQPDKVVRQAERAIDRRRRVAVIDRRWNLLTGLWRLLPNSLWVRLRIKTSL